MKIISINAGSSSLKFQLFDMSTEKVLAKGLFERIGIEGSCYTLKYNDEKITEEINLSTHTEAVNILLEKLVDLNIIKSLDEIEGVGHRIVQGGDKYKNSVIITDEVITDIESLKELAPLHNPAGLLGIKAFKEVLPDVKMVAVFDTAFHQTMDEESYLYPVPYSWYKNYKVRKYGFHGTSHKFIAETVKEIEKKDLKIISCHIGSGGSITAIQDGRSIDTTMGFTPLSGIMMGTRSGDVDPSIIPYVMAKEGKNAGEIVSDLNRKSGFLGMSELSSDYRDIIKGKNEGNEKCVIAEKKFIKTIVSYIANYYVLLGGADVIVFTAGVGENNAAFRKAVCEKLSCLGVKIDDDKNNDEKVEIRKISAKNSKVKVYLIPTNEELMIARDTLRLVK